jgi:hypothetical protein
MPKKRVHKPDHDAHGEKHGREFAREQRGKGEVDESLRHRSAESVVEGGVDEKRGEPRRPGQETHKGPAPLINK